MKKVSKVIQPNPATDSPKVMDTRSMSLTDRILAPTPKFFKTLRNIGMVLAATGGAILASPVAVPAALISVAGYVVLAGGIITAVSQTSVQHDE